jgi:hypothetical protein
MILLGYAPVTDTVTAVYAAGSLLGVIHRVAKTHLPYQLDGRSQERYRSRELAAWALVTTEAAS